MPARKNARGQWIFRKVVTDWSGRKVRIFGTPEVNTKAAAEAAERAEIRRVQTQPPPETVTIPTFAVFVERYMEVAPLHQAPSEIEGKEQKLRAIILPAVGHLPLDRIGRAELDAMKVQLRDRAPRTVNNYLAVVGAVLDYAVEVGVLASKPAMGMLDVPDQAYEEYSDAEIDALARAGRDVYERCAILLGGDAGLRAGEIRALRRDDVGAGKVRVQQSEWFGTLKTTKGKRTRTVPMTPRLKAAVEACMRAQLGPATQPLLLRGEVSRRGRDLPWSREVMRERIEHMAAAAGVPNRGWHALRHAFCSRLARGGVPARTIQVLAGHAAITTTERYMHVAPDVVEAAVAVLDRGTHLAPSPVAENAEGREP